MRIIYNGIDMSVLQDTYKYEMEPVFDDSGTDYLYTRHSIACNTLVNGQVDLFTPKEVDGSMVANGPAVTYTGSAMLSSSPPTTPFSTAAAVSRPGTDSDPVSAIFAAGYATVPFTAGAATATREPLFIVTKAPNPAPSTMWVIRQRLSEPRGRLFVTTPLVEPPAGGAVPGPSLVPMQLVSPDPAVSSVCDCKNGPFPLVTSINQVYGDDRTFLVAFAVQTFINEYRKNGINTSTALLSNRFSQTASTDDRGYTTLTTVGKAVFRSDWLNLRGAAAVTPDVVRAELMLKIPLGFVRDNIDVTSSPDGTGLVYRFIDRQVEVNFPGGTVSKAAKISAVHRQAITNNSDVFSGALTAYERALGLAANKNIAKPHPGAAPGSNPRLPYSPPPAE